MIIPSITPYTGDLPLRSNPPTFPANAEDYVTWQEGTMVPEINATVAAMNAAVATMSAIAAGGAMALPYVFSSTTTDADPGAGFMRLSSGTQNASTVIRLDLVGADGSTWTDVINTFDDSTSAVKGHILLQCLTDATKWLEFSVSSVASPSGYKNLTVVPVASSATNPFTNGDSLVLKFTATGDKGDIGPGGALVLLATLTPTAAANVDSLSVFSGTYDNYLIIASGLKPSSNDSLNMRFAVAGTPDTGSKYFSAGVAGASVAANTGMALSSTFTSAGLGGGFDMTVSNANDATNAKTGKSTASGQDSATPTFAGVGYAHAYNGANAISGFRLYWNGGANFVATGKVRVYGYSNT